MITIDLWRDVDPYYADLGRICLGVVLTPFAVAIDLLLSPIELVALAIKLLVDWYEWGK